MCSLSVQSQCALCSPFEGVYDSDSDTTKMLFNYFTENVGQLLPLNNRGNVRSNIASMEKDDDFSIKRNNPIKKLPIFLK